MPKLKRHEMPERDQSEPWSKADFGKEKNFASIQKSQFFIAGQGSTLRSELSPALERRLP